MPSTWTPLPALISKNWSNIIGIAPRYTWMVKNEDPQMRKTSTKADEAKTSNDNARDETDEPGGDQLRLG